MEESIIRINTKCHIIVTDKITIIKYNDYTGKIDKVEITHSELEKIIQIKNTLNKQKL